MGTLDLFKNLGFSNDQLSNTFKSTGTNLSNLGFSSTNLTNNTNTGTQSAYQFNLQEPVQQKQKTGRDVLGSILKAAETNPEYAQKKLRALNYLQSDPTSSFYYPYYNPTNNAHERLAELGFDSSVINDEWWDNNKDWQNYLVYGGTTNSPTKPTKTGKSAEQYNTEMTSYWLNQLYKEKDTSAAVQKEWAAMQEELTYWTNRADLNLSDDEIVAKVNKDKKNKYPTLYKLDQSLTDTNKNLVELNEGTDYSPDNMYGVVWAARNGKTGDPIIEYTAQSGAGYGKQWEDNPEVREKLEWGNPNYSPFSVKSTMDEACCYFNKPYFTKEDIVNLKVDENDATAVKMYNQLIDAEGFTEKAEEEVALVDRWLSTKLETATDPEKLMKSFDAFLDANCPNLKKMDNSMKKIDSLVDTTRPIDYSRNDVFKKVNEACTKNTGKDTFGQTMDKYGVNTGTDANKALFAAGDQKVVEVAFSYSNGMTDSEKTYFEYAPSAHNSEYANLYRQTIDEENDLPVKTQGQVSSDYVSGYIPLYTDVQTNKNAQLQLDNLNKRNEELVENCDMIRDAYRSGSSDFSFLYNIEDGETVQKGDAYVQNSRYVPALLELYERVTGESATDEDGLIRQDAVKTAKEFFDYIENGGRTYEEDEELPWIFSEFTGKRAELEKTIADTADAQSKIDNMNSELDHRIEVYDRNGIDTVELRAAKYVSEAMTYFADYEATEWTAYNKYDLMMRGEESGATFEEVKKAAVMGSIQIKKELEACLWYKEYIDENGIELPENYINNLDRHIAMLERDQEDFDYFMLQEKSDFKAGAEKGREMEKSKDIGKLDVKTIASAVADNSFGTFDAIMKGLEYSPFYDILTDEEKDTFYYLRSQDDGFIKAAEYYEHLADPTYGVLNTRNRVNIQKGAAEEVNSGILGGTWANIKAILSAPVDFLGNATYMLYAALNDKELNPDSAFRASSQYSTAVNAATVDAIHEGLKDSPVLDTLLSGMYEIAYNRGRSLVNGLTFGWMTKGIDTELIKEIIGALPMAIDAAGSAAANAKSRGAEDWQAYSIAGITAFAESVTEGLTYGNITEALYGGDQGVAVRTFKDMMINWLTSSGVEEMIGESANDIIENLGDRYILGALSEHQDSVNEWIEKLGLDPNNPADVKLAEDYATKDEAAALLHTALISYLSPGLDVFTGSIRDTLNDMRNVRSITNNLKARELDISGEEIREEYKNYKQGLMNGEYKYGEGYKQEGITENQRMIRAAAEGIRNAPTDAQIEQARQEAEARVEAEYQQRRMSDADQQFIQDLSAFDTSEKSDAVTQTAALAAIFGRTNNAQDIHLANAAAILIQKAFGGLSNAVTKVKSILNAAHQFGIDYQNVKTALEVASLSESSQAAQVVASEEFQNATPEQQAEMLASTVEGDMQNQTVMEEANTAIRENRIAEKEAKLAEDGAYDELEDKRIYYEGEQHSLSVAEQDVEDHRREEEIKVNAALNDATNAANEMAMNPTDENRNWVDRAMGAFNKATEVMESVVKQWEEHRDKIAQAAQDAKEKYENALRDKQTEVRQQAEQMVDEEDRQMAEAAAQQEEQARIEAEEQARIQAEEDELTGKAQEDRENQAIENTVAAENKQGIDAINRADELKEQRSKVKIKLRDLSKPVTKAEALLALKEFERKLGTRIDLVDLGPVSKEGWTRGKYSKDGTIQINKNMTLGQALVEAALHEITHFMRNTNAYGSYRNIVMGHVFGEAGDARAMYDNDTSGFRAKVDATIAERVAAGDENFVGKSLDEQIAAAEDEIVADYARLNLAEKDVVERFIDAGMGAKMREVLHNINQALKNYLSNMTDEERRQAEYFRKAEHAFQKAMFEAAKKQAHPAAEQFSVVQMAQSTGMNFNPETLQLFMPDGREVDGVNTRVTPEMIVNTPVGMLIDMGLSDDVFIGKDGNEHTQKGDARQMFADLMNLCARYKDNNLIWEIAGSEFAENFSALKSNSDPQYKTTVDFGTICAKTQAIVDVISGTMLERIKSYQAWNEAHPDDQKVFTGLTRDDVMMVYNQTHDANLTVPCPVCYVFSRWMGVPSLLGQMNRFQHEYVVTQKGADGRTLYDENGDAMIDWVATKKVANDYVKFMLTKYGSKDKIADAKTSLGNKLSTRENNLPKLQEARVVLQKDLLNKQTELDNESAREGMDAKERKKLETKLKNDIKKINGKLDTNQRNIEKNISESTEIEEQLRELEGFNWVTQALCKQHTEEKGRVVNDVDENGDYVLDENFRITPEEILFDLNRTGEFAAYKKNWKYRTTRGAGMGKAIMPYSGSSLGDIINGQATRWQQDQNPFYNMDRTAAEKAFENAKKRVLQQNLVGGQRFQSTSDFRPEWGLDYVMSFLEMQALGSKVQMYTKVAEAVDFLGSIGADVNLSIMARGNGFHEATEEEIEQAKTDKELASRMGVLDGKTYVMDFSDITGMDYNTAKGKTKKFNNVQMILVGMNDLHIRLAMGNEDIDFIIPWHSSGNSKDVLQSLVASVGEALNESSDYTDTQTDQDKSHKEKIDGKEKTIDDRTEDEIKLWDARVKLLSEGGEALTEEERRTLLSNPYTRELYKRFTQEGYDPDCYGVKLPKAQAEQIFPYEYWDKTSTRENADVNGKRFTEYCDALGKIPRFSQFANDPGYWKLLIDRKMYDNNVLNEDGTVKEYGKYRDQKVVDVTNAKIDTDASQELDAEQARKAQVYQLPESTTAKYGGQYTQQTQDAIYNANAALERKYGVFGRYDAYQNVDKLSYSGELSAADEQMMNGAGSDLTMDDIDQWFDEYIDGLSADELDKLSQEMFGISLSSPSDKSANTLNNEVRAEEPTYTAEKLREMYKEAISNGDMDAARNIIGKIAKAAGYTVYGTHRTNAEFTVFEKSKQSGKRGKSLGDGFYIASGENTEYDDNTYGKNRMLVYVNPGNVFDIQKGGLSEQEAKYVYDKYYAPYHPNVKGYNNPYTDHVLSSLQNSYKVIDYIKGAAENVNTTTDEVFKDLGYNSVKDGPQYCVFDSNQIKLAEPVTFDDEGNAIPIEERFSGNDDIRYSMDGEMSDADFSLANEQELNKTLVESGALTQEDVDAYNERTGRPLEGRSTKWRQAEGPAQRQFAAGMLQDSDEIAEQAREYALAHNAYFPDTNEDQINRAINWIRKNGNRKNEDGSYMQTTDGYNESLQKITSKNFDYRSADGQARMVAMMGMAVAKNDVTAQVALADAFNRQGTDLGRSLQSRKLFRLMTPEGRIGTLQKMLENTQTELDSKDKNVDLKFSEWIYRAAAAATEEGDFQKVQQAAAQELAEQLPANWKDRIRSLRMLSMLANPRTHIRNVLGNAFFIPAVGLKNKLGAIAELGVNEGEKTKTMSPFLSKEARRFAREDVQTMKDELTGEAKYNEDSMVQREQKAFKGLLQGLIDFNSNALEKEDWKFLKGHYIRALGGWMMANGYTEEQLRSDPSLLEKGRTYAVQEAQKATYRDFSKAAQALNKLSDVKGLGFLIDAALPFKKTPINILKRGMEYSPAGIMRSLTTDLYHLKRWNDYQDGKLKALPDKALSPTQFIDRLCSGLSGTAVMALGFLLGSAGVVSVSLDDDEDELEKEKGAQKYAFKFSIGGKDFTYTMDWAAPMSMPFFVGAAIQEQVSDQDDVTIDKVFNAMANISEPVFNLSMLDGVNTLFKTSQYDDTNSITQILAKVGLNYATSFVPSALGAFTKTFVDSYRRKAFVPSDQSQGVTGTARYSLEQTENKIPGLSQTNIPYRNVWGEAETSGFVERLFENFISPGYIQEYKDDPILNEMGRLYDVTGDASMIPSDPAKSVTYEKQKYVLTAEQWDHYKEVRGQTAFEVLSALIDTDSYKNADNSTQVQMIKDAWSYADAVGKSTFIPNYEVPKMGDNPTEKIAKDATITGYKNEMIKALNANDWEAYDTMVEALRQADVEDSDIKEKLSNTYRNQWKDAYRNDDEQKMAEIEEILDNTGFSFNIYGKGGWMQKVDEEND